MPPMPAIPNVISILMQGTIPGEIWENGYMFQYSGTTPSAAALTQIATAANNQWVAFMIPESPSPTVFTQVTVTDLNSNTGAQSILLTGVAGSRGDDPIPANAALLVSYPVSLRYRGGHFRNYLMVGGFSDLQDPMNFHTAFVSEVQTHHNNFLAAMVGVSSGGTTLTQHVGVRRHGKDLPNEGPPHYVLNTPIILPINQNAGIYHQQIASQKGRIGRRSK